jgi:hypothetical protein
MLRINTTSVSIEIAIEIIRSNLVCVLLGLVNISKMPQNCEGGFQNPDEAPVPLFAVILKSKPEIINLTNGGLTATARKPAKTMFWIISLAISLLIKEKSRRTIRSSKITINVWSTYVTELPTQLKNEIIK